MITVYWIGNFDWERKKAESRFISIFFWLYVLYVPVILASFIHVDWWKRMGKKPSIMFVAYLH